MKKKTLLPVFLIAILVSSVLISIAKSNPATVATSPLYNGVIYGYMRKSFYATGRFWVFYSDGTNAFYESSTDGTTWTGSPTSIGACIAGYRFSIWFDGTYVHYARYVPYDIFYRRGTPESDGSITWSAIEQKAHDGDSLNYYLYPCITVDSDGYAWIGGRHEPDDYPYVLKNANNDGTWTLDFAYQLSATSSTSWKVAVVPLTLTKVYVIYIRNYEAPLGKLYDAGWGSEESDLTDYDIQVSYQFSSVADGDNVHFVYNRKNVYSIRYNNRTSGSWGTDDVLVQDGVESYCTPALSIDTATSDLYCFWTHALANYVYYRQYSSGVWGGRVGWIDESADGIEYDFFVSSYYQDYGGYIGLLYVTKTGSPYNIKFEYRPKEAPTEDYVDNSVSDVDSSVDKGTHSNFENQKATDSTYDTLTETLFAGALSTEELPVNGFTNVEADWVEVGSTPYLDAIDYDTNYIWESAVDGHAESRFDFTDSSGSGIINEVKLCMYSTQDARKSDGQIDYYLYNSTGGNTPYNLGSFVPIAGSWAWENVTVTSTLSDWTEINNAQFRFVADRVGGADILYMDMVLLWVNSSAINYQLDLEIQWIDVNYTRTYEELCIKTGSTDSEDIKVYVWHSSSWNLVFSDLTANSWNNISVSTYLDSYTFTVRFLGGIETSDTNQDSWQIDGALLHTWESLVNNPPTNDACSITDMDDSDNLYAQISGGYSIDYDGHDDDGYVDIDYVLVNITQAATVRVSFKYDNSLNTFSIIDGSSEFTLDGSSSASRAGNNINLTIVFHVQWDATEEAAIELKCVIADDEPSSDTDTMQTDYADVVTNLVVSGFSCDDDRGDVSQTIIFTGTVYYANNPASSTATTFYPPDAEFTAVHVYDSGDNDKGNDNTVVNGAFSVSFAASASVGIETYNPYIDMDDADYSDAEESPSDTFISDRMQLLTLSSNATALYTGEYTEIRATAELEYDHHALGSGDSLTIEGLALSWDAGDSRFEGSETSEVELSKTYDEGVGTEATFGITVVNMDGNSVTVTWEDAEELAKIEFLWLGILVNLILVPLLIIFLYAIRRRR